MTVTEQTYEWVSVAPNGTAGQGFSIGRTPNAIPVAIPINQPIDIFTGGFGNNISTQPRVGILDFIVVDYLACSPHREGSTQLRINSTDYFQGPDDISTITNINGISGKSSPYPCGTQEGKLDTLGVADPAPASLLKSFDLEPPVYILPGQTWSVVYTTGTGIVGDNSLGSNESAAVAAIVKYTLYHGTDALVANKLLEIGMPVTQDNAQWLKRQIRKGGTL
jgi:hypothetical protein